MLLCITTLYIFGHELRTGTKERGVLLCIATLYMFGHDLNWRLQLWGVCYCVLQHYTYLAMIWIEDWNQEEGCVIVYYNTLYILRWFELKTGTKERAVLSCIIKLYIFGHDLNWRLQLRRGVCYCVLQHFIYLDVIWIKDWNWGEGCVIVYYSTIHIWTWFELNTTNKEKRSLVPSSTCFWNNLPCYMRALKQVVITIKVPTTSTLDIYLLLMPGFTFDMKKCLIKEFDLAHIGI